MQNKSENTERPSAGTSSSPSNAGNLDTAPGATTSCPAAPCSAWVEQVQSNGSILFKHGESFGGLCPDKEKMARIKKWMES